jgi:hypothetical protein
MKVTLSPFINPPQASHYYNGNKFGVLKGRCRSQWPHGLWRGSAVSRLLGLWVRIPNMAWMSVSCECCVLSGRGLCDQRSPTECSMSECDREASNNEAA